MTIAFNVWIVNVIRLRTVEKKRIKASLSVKASLLHVLGYRFSLESENASQEKHNPFHY